jgi:hypothetical protein
MRLTCCCCRLLLLLFHPSQASAHDNCTSITANKPAAKSSSTKSSQPPKQLSPDMAMRKKVLAGLQRGSSNLVFELEVVRTKLHNTQQQVSQVCRHSCNSTGCAGTDQALVQQLAMHHRTLGTLPVALHQRHPD